MSSSSGPLFKSSHDYSLKSTVPCPPFPSENSLRRAPSFTSPIDLNQRKKREEIQALLDDERALVIKLEPLPFAISLDQLHEFAFSLSDPPYHLPVPDWVDTAKGTLGFFGYKDPHDNLLLALYPALMALNKLETNTLDLDRLRAVGFECDVSLTGPLRWSFIGAGYTSGSVLGLVSSWERSKTPEGEEKEAKISGQSRTRKLENGTTVVRRDAGFKRRPGKMGLGEPQKLKSICEQIKQVEHAIKEKKSRERLAQKAKAMVANRTNRLGPHRGTSASRLPSEPK